jgi:glycosyltransferase involved in cell wall biosynthesis
MHCNRLIVYAPNIHQGGGKSLLLGLINTSHQRTVFFLDSRFLLPDELKGKCKIFTINATIIERFKAEASLLRFSTKNDIVLCFGNLPPFFRLPSLTIVYLQNRYIVDSISLKNFSLLKRLRITIERFWFIHRSTMVDKYVVQTKTMKSLLANMRLQNTSINVAPFLENSLGYLRKLKKTESRIDCLYDFLYIASGEPHKNHKILIQAWVLLANENLYPSLCLTLDSSQIDDLLTRYGFSKKLRIYNVGIVPHVHALLLYTKSKALIYPSKFESFGIPLVEARQAGLPILASELDYVRDVLDPEETFDPESPVSIARAVKRFMGLEESALPLMNAAQFAASLFQEEVI